MPAATPTRGDTVVKVELDGHLLAFAADGIARIANVADLDLDDEPSCDLAALFGLEAPEERYAVLRKGGGWLLIGASLTFDSADEGERPPLPHLIADHCHDLGVVGLTTSEGRLALVLDLAQLPLDDDLGEAEA